MALKSKGGGAALAVLGGAAFVYWLLSRKTLRAGRDLTGYGWYEPSKMFPVWWPGRSDGCDDCDWVVRRWGWVPEPRWDWSPTTRRWGWNSSACMTGAPGAIVGSPEADNLLVHWYGPASDGAFNDRVSDLRKAGATCSDDRIARCSWRGASFAVVHDVEGSIRCHITGEGGLTRPAIWTMIDPVLSRSAASW